MLFGRKKYEAPRNHEGYKAMWRGLQERAETLELAAEYTRKVLDAIELYPEGADKEAEKRELTKARNSLLAAVADYDGRRAELTNFYLSHLSELEGTVQINWRPSQWPTSHQIVRNAG